jgi:hypothetical protein
MEGPKINLKWLVNRKDTAVDPDKLARQEEDEVIANLSQGCNSGEVQQFTVDIETNDAGSRTIEVEIEFPEP